MSAFKTNEDEIKLLIRRVDIGFDPEEWDDDDRLELAREIRKETKPMVIAANKMDTPEAQENYEEITTDPAYEHLTIVPVAPTPRKPEVGRQSRRPRLPTRRFGLRYLG